MLRPALFTSLLLSAPFALAACSGRITSGGAAGDGGEAEGGNDGDDATQPSGDDAAVNDGTLDDVTGDGSATGPDVSLLPEGAPDDAPNPPADVFAPGPDAYVPPTPPPNGCGGVCSGVTSSSGQLDTQGRWALCQGQLPLAGPTEGGFPADTAGIEFDANSNTAYMLVVDGDGGSFVRGPGLAYVWQWVPGTSGSASYLTFNNTYNGYQITFEETFFAEGDVCPADMHFICMSSGVPLYQSDFLQTP